MWNEKKVQVNLSAKQSYRCRKQTNVYQGIREGGINWEIRSDMYIALLIHTKQITNKDPLYNTGRASTVVLVVKNLPANAGHVRDTGLILGLGRSPGGGTGRPLSILAWRIAWIEKPGELQPMSDHKESDMTEVT